jgi:aldehyde:ferredoxin oxidoreductase
VLCQASNIYEKFPQTRTGDTNSLLGTRLCDGYGMDTSVIQAMIEFLDVCYKEGILTEKQTGLPLSNIGSVEFSQKFMRMVAFKEGFGDILAKGIIPAAGEIGQKAKDILHMFVATRGSEKKDYDPRVLMTTAIAYATEPRRPIQQLHEISSMCMAWLGMGLSPGAKPGSMFSAADFRKVAERLWGSKIAADFSTYEGKALAAKKMQDRVFAKESLVLCDLRWTMSQAGRVLGTTKDTVTEEQVYTAITGKEIDTSEFNRTGERIFNVQRAILLRQGWGGRKGDTILDYFFTEPFKKNELFFNAEGLMPGKDGETISKIGATVDREKFEQMKTEYYELRGWDNDGYPTKAKLRELELDDVAEDLGKRGLAGK